MNYLAQIDFGQLRDVFPVGSLAWESLKIGGLGWIITRLLPSILVIAGLALLLYLIYGGFQLMTSGGDPGKVKEARAIITHAVAGFFIIFIAYWIIQAVGLIFGIQEIGNIFRLR